MSYPDEERAPGSRAHGLPSASARRPGPFSSVPVRDYITDVLAIVLLCVALGLAWDADSAATDRVEVVLTTVVSILSLSLFYLARAGAMPPGWTNRTVVAVRAAANVPYVVVVLVYVVLDVVAAFDDGLGSRGGLGPSVAIGLAGVALVVAPRAAEIGAPRTADLFARAVRTALVSLLAVMLMLQVLGIISVLVDSPDILDRSGGWAFLLSAIVRALLITAIAAVPLLGTVLRHAPWRALLVTVAAVTTFYLLFLNSLNGVGREVLLTLSVAGANAALILVPAAGALALTPAVRRTLRSAPVDAPERPWFATASLAWLSIAAVAALYAVVQVLWLVGVALRSEDGVPAWFVVFVVVLVFAAVAAVVARTIFFGSPSSARVPALAVTAVVVVLGVVAVSLVGSSADGFFGAGVNVGVELLLVAFGLPALAAIALLVPAPVRAWFAEHAEDEPLRQWRDDDEPTFAAARGEHSSRVSVPPTAAAAAPLAPLGSPARGADEPGRAEPDTGEVPAAERVELVELSREETRDEPTLAQEPVPAVEPIPAAETRTPDPSAPFHSAGAGPATTEPATVEFETADFATAEPATAEPATAEPATVAPGTVAPAAGEPLVGSTPVEEPVAGSEQDVLGTPGLGDDGAGSVDRPVPHSAGTVAPTHPFTADQALDPSTDLDVLAAIAAQAPELRVHLAANPSTYPDLLHWLAQLGDPAIDAALARRGA
jgi:hypothetical protein